MLCDITSILHIRDSHRHIRCGYSLDSACPSLTRYPPLSERQPDMERHSRVQTVSLRLVIPGVRFVLCCPFLQVAKYFIFARRAKGFRPTDPNSLVTQKASYRYTDTQTINASPVCWENIWSRSNKIKQSIPIKQSCVLVESINESINQSKSINQSINQSLK